MHLSSRLLAGALLLAAPAAFAQASATASATATATVYKGTTLSKNADMNFGTIYSSSSLGTVTLPAAATPTLGFTGGASLASGGTAAAAMFTMSGKKSAAYTITLPSASVDLLDAVSGAKMKLTAFTASIATTGTAPADGSDVPFYVGGTLDLLANQAEGVYSGTFSVTVAYN